MRYLYLFFMIACFSLAQAQLNVVSFTPADNSTNVPLSTSISITFNMALDTTYHLDGNKGIFSNVEAPTARYYSPDLRTITFDVVLAPAKVYLVCTYFARAQGGGILQSPAGVMFTTGSSFPPYWVSGNVSSGETGVPPGGALVILSSTPASEGAPNAVSGTLADAAGAYVLPYIANGTYYPIAAKDVNGDGEINPGSGDVIAMGDPVTVNNANRTGVNLSFLSMAPISYTSAFTLADSISFTLPADKSLRYIGSWDVDTLGKATDWEFLYLMNSGTTGYRIKVGSMDRHWENLDSGSCGRLVNARALNDAGSAATSAAFLANVENSGGREFRRQTPVGNLRFSCEVNLGDLSRTSFERYISDPSQNYWGARYSFGYDSSNQWVDVVTRIFLGNYSTGAILLATDVKSRDDAATPLTFTLSQNYPNPFNPSTQIRFSVPKEDWTTLKVYNLIGQEVATLVQGLVPAGEYAVRFDGANLTSGIYFYRLASGTHVLTNKMLLLK